MVKIINDEPDKSVVKRVVCRHCGATLEYLPIDVKRRDGIDYSGGPDGREWIDCPKCGTTVTLRSW